MYLTVRLIYERPAKLSMHHMPGLPPTAVICNSSVLTHSLTQSSSTSPATKQGLLNINNSLLPYSTGFDQFINCEQLALLAAFVPPRRFIAPLRKSISLLRPLAPKTLFHFLKSSYYTPNRILSLQKHTTRLIFFDRRRNASIDVVFANYLVKKHPLLPKSRYTYKFTPNIVVFKQLKPSAPTICSYIQRQRRKILRAASSTFQTTSSHLLR